MSDVFYLSAEQIERIQPFFPLSHGVPRVDDRRVISGIIYILKRACNGKRLHVNMALIKHCIIALTAGAFLACSTPSLPNWPNRLVRTAASLLKKGLFPAVSDAQKAG